MLKEFRDFINRGNVVDMAVGIIIGGAFGKIVASLVGDIVMPVVGLILKGTNLTNMFVAMDGKHYATLAEAEAAGAAVLKYGNFIQALVDFLIISFVIFLIIRKINSLKKPAPQAAPSTKQCPYCKQEIAIDAVKCPYCTADLK